MKRQIIPKSFKGIAVILKLWQALRTFGHFQSFFSKIWLTTPLRKSVAMETWQDLDHYLYRFLPLTDSPNGLQKLKFVESAVFEIMRGRLPTPSPYVEVANTKYLRTGRVKSIYFPNWTYS